MGRVRNVQRWVKSKGPGKKLLPVVVRKLQLNRYGYPVACLNGKAKPVLKSVHRMVVEAFIGPIPDGMQVNHKDGNKQNNHLDNLEVCTGSENQIHRHRVLGQHIGERHPLSRLKESDVHRIRLMIRNGIDDQKIANAHCVNRSTVRNIRIGKIWSWLTER